MKIVKGEGVIKEMSVFLDENYSKTPIYIICGYAYSKAISKTIGESIKSKTNILSVTDSEESIHETSLGLDPNSILIGVGGGKMMDIAKEIAFQNDLELILFPTIISNDGLANGLVVLDSVNNGQSIYRKPADYIFVDFDIINSAPEVYLKSAIGDVFSNYSSINDFEFQKENYSYDEFKEVKKSIFKSLSIIESVNDLEIEETVNSIIESGKTVEILKNSSAISGSEHLILHSLESIYQNIKVNHGIAVASISLFTLFVQSELKDKHIKFVKQNNIPISFIEMYNIGTEELYEVFEVAKSYRPNRKTILNKYRTVDLVNKLILLEKYLKTALII